MSYTKAEMLRDMETAREFHQVPFRIIVNAQQLKTISGFVPVCQYGRGMSLVMVKGELGCTGGTRFKLPTRLSGV